MSKLIVDPEFKSLIPSLQPDEFEQLRANIKADGCRDPIVVWDGKSVIVDGHNRYMICTEFGLPFKTASVSFDSREHAKLWIEENQLGRRNVSDDVRAAMAVSVLERRTAIARRERAQKAGKVGGHVGGRGREKKDDIGLSAASSDKPIQQPKQDSRKAVAKKAGVSERKIKQAAKLKKDSPKKFKEVHQGKKGIAEAIREVKRENQIIHLEDIKVKEVKAIQGVYDVIVIDPPWPMEKIERDVRPNQAEMPYPVMSEIELSQLAIPCATDCHVWLWTTHRFMPMAFRLLDSWGLKYVCAFVWHKPGGFQPIGLPQYNCEFALYARQGAPSFIDTKAFPVCFDAPRGKHSEKPEQFYDVIRRVTAGRRIDMFNRREIEGFDGWGKESAA